MTPLQDRTISDPTEAFKRAQALEQEGRAQEAETLYRQLLASYPGQPALLHRLSLLLKTRGALTEAESLLRRAIASTPHESVLHNNLGNVLRAGERFLDAEKVYRKAVDLNPNYAEAFYNLGICLEDLDQFGEALAMHQRSIAIKPDYAQARTRIGVILRHQRKFEEALSELDTVTALGPPTFETLYYRGVTLADLERFEEAAACLEQAVALKPTSFDALRALANNLRSATRFDESLDAYWRAMELQPTNPSIHEELNAFAWMADKPETFLKSFAYARDLHGEDPGLMFVEATIRMQRNDGQNAERLLNRLLTMAPERADAHALYGRLLSRRGRHEESFEAFHAAVTSDPGFAAYRNEFGFALLRGKQAKQSLEQFEAARRINPFDQLALGGMCVAYRDLGDSRYHDLVNIPSLARTFQLKVPSGHADTLAFNAALAEELSRLHTMSAEPLEQTLRGGTQTPGLLFTRKSKLIDQLRESIADAVATYISEMSANADHPLLSRKEPDFSFTHSWSCKLRSSGFHTNHVHPMGWISSAYYVSIPEFMDDKGQRQGWLKFGESHMELGHADRPEHFVKPVIGQLVLFPSYFWHGTVPFQSADDRLTVAFDVVPGNVQIAANASETH